MDLRGIWADEQRDFAGKIKSIIWKRLYAFQDSINDTNGRSGFLGFGVKQSDRAIFSDLIEAFAQCDAIRLVTGRDIDLLNTGDEIFPLWGDFSTWSNSAQNKKKTEQKFVELSGPELAICKSKIDEWMDCYLAGESVELRDIPLAIFNEIKSHQITLGNYQSAKVLLLSYQVDLDIVLSEIDKRFNDSNNIKTQVLTGTSLWHVGCFDSVSGPVITDASPLWTTNDYSKRLDYQGQKLQAEKDKLPGSGPVYLISATTKTALTAADFTGTTFVGLECKGKDVAHDFIRLALGVWAELNKFSAVIGTNLGDHEVVICKPLTDLNYKFTRIPSLVQQPLPKQP